jgi:uroporphyrinogen-III decarboxylase
MQQLISYIALGAPATRRPATGKLPFLRPEIGFTPNWYHQSLGIDFGEKFHSDPVYRKQALAEMRNEIDRRFPGNEIGKHGDDATPDLLTGLFGACSIAAIYGVPIRYETDQWPVSEHVHILDEEMGNLRPPDLSVNPFFKKIMEQVDWIARNEGKVYGFMNWQGVLNNAQRIRGQELFMDFYMNPDAVKNLLDCVCTTMIDAAKILQQKQRESGVDFTFFTVSNCLVNMLSPELYAEFILLFDQKIARAFETIGIHNCAWNATPYLDDYAKVSKVGYIDMGMDSDLEMAKSLFPKTRRAIMYTPMDVANKTREQIRKDLEFIAEKYGSCDIVAADIEHGTPDEKVIELIKICNDISEKTVNKN